MKIEWKKIEKKDFEKLVDFFSMLGKGTLNTWRHYGIASPQFRAIKAYEEKSLKIGGFIEGEMVVYGYLIDDLLYPGVPALGMVVRDDYQGMGIGKECATRLIKCGEEIGAKAIYLTTFDEDKRSQSLFEQLGWKKVGIIYSWKKKAIQYKLWLGEKK